MKKLKLLTACLLVSLSFVPVQATTSRSASLLQSGDLLDITIFNNPDLSRTNIPIAPDGRIYYLMIPSVQAAGRPLSAVIKDLENSLGTIVQYPQIDISIKQRPRNQFIILGQVTRPGLYDISTGLTLRDAIAECGGIIGKQSEENTNVDINGAFVMKNNGRVITINMLQLLNTGDDGKQIQIEPGDYIYIAELAGKKIYILGQIDQPQAMTYKNDLTLLKALATLSKTTYDKCKPYLDNIAIIRGQPEHRSVIKVEAKNILEGKAQDFKLLPQDIIYIPEKQIDWAELGDIASKAYTTAFATKAATYTFDTIKALAGMETGTKK